MKRTFQLGIAPLFLLCLLTGCASDPFQNAGKCDEIAATQVVDGKLAICSGFEKAYKWYFEGDSYEAVKVIGFIESSKANAGLDNGDYEAFYNAVIAKNKTKASELFDYMLSPKNLAEAVQKVANGEERWDKLVATVSEYAIKSTQENEAFGEQLKITSDAIKANNFKGKLPYSQEYVDAHKRYSDLAAESSKLQDDVAPLLQVFESYLQNKLGISDPLRAAKALAAVKLAG
jgi:hypothetical protein